MNYQINISQMRKKTQIENNLLEQINLELKSCKDELNQIYSTKKITSDLVFTDSKLINIYKIFDEKNISCDKQYELIEKIFAHIEQTYWVFQYFYLKKKDFMGMNLTGLIEGRMETGLGFRKCLEKMSIQDIKSKYPELCEIKEHNIDNIWKIKSDTFGWKEYGFDIVPKNIIVVSNFDSNTYSILLEKI